MKIPYELQDAADMAEMGTNTLSGYNRIAYILARYREGKITVNEAIDKIRQR